MTFRPMPILTVLSLISLGILFMLGNWQYQRYSEKMIGSNTARPLADILTVDLETDLPGNVQQVYGAVDSAPVWRRYAVGSLKGSDERLLVMVEAVEGATPFPLALSKLPDHISFEGNLIEREAKRGMFTPADKPENDVWNTMDPVLIGERLGLTQSTVRVAEPLLMTVRNGANPVQTKQTQNPYAYAKPIDPLPPERHFGYAITWWGMALGLIGVYLALHHSRGRLRFRQAK